MVHKGFAHVSCILLTQKENHMHVSPKSLSSSQTRSSLPRSWVTTPAPCATHVTALAPLPQSRRWHHQASSNAWLPSQRLLLPSPPPPPHPAPAPAPAPLQRLRFPRQGLPLSPFSAQAHLLKTQRKATDVHLIS
ncbi:formin-like protein 14 [Canis lupus familiaris]|uniref:formin-like protein 14 n=1 Tax=Canis lupus familiaris TaxID=9615 RepID=UPI0018F6EA95|nr:formin-like protein 14 [Canis lupus familiaris]